MRAGRPVGRRHMILSLSNVSGKEVTLEGLYFVLKRHSFFKNHKVNHCLLIYILVYGDRRSHHLCNRSSNIIPTCAHGLEPELVAPAHWVLSGALNHLRGITGRSESRERREGGGGEWEGWGCRSTEEDSRAVNLRKWESLDHTLHSV